jgi:hypothetical protein
MLEGTRREEGSIQDCSKATRSRENEKNRGKETETETVQGQHG